MASGGKEALAYVKERHAKHGDTYDLVFMDQVMPDCDGIKSAELIREFLEGKEQNPFICLMATAYGNSL